jgi:H+/Cl- antiporter ClcA
MKRSISIILGVVLGLVVGAIAAYFFNTWYGSNHVHSDDDSNFLVSLLIFVFLPGFALIGGILASRFYARSGT